LNLSFKRAEGQAFSFDFTVFKEDEGCMVALIAATVA
jgi:hypothetical protein